MPTLIPHFLLVAVVGACVGSVGGWDVAALLADRPDLAEIPGARIGDLTPFPAPSKDGVVLVVCRFDGSEPIRVRGAGAGWPAVWARMAVSAVDRSLPGVDLVLTDDVSERVVEIAIQSVEEPEAEGPAGLADTFSECDVSVRKGAEGHEDTIRGSLVRSEIRIRRAQRRPTRRVQTATEEVWVGALLHELGHALGFVGHAAVGESVVYLEASALRMLGRRASAGERVPTPNLAALYALEPGRVLGRAMLDPVSRENFAAVRALVDRWTERRGPPVDVFASAGDRGARLRWRWTDGWEITLDFPDWRRQLRAGEALRAVPSIATRRRLSGLAADPAG